MMHSVDGDKLNLHLVGCDTSVVVNAGKHIDVMGYNFCI